jgi:hypothetical protein
MTALRLSDNEQPGEQLEPLAGEHPEVDEPLVFHATPAPRLHGKVDRAGHA